MSDDYETTPDLGSDCEDESVDGADSNSEQGTEFEYTLAPDDLEYGLEASQIVFESGSAITFSTDEFDDELVGDDSLSFDSEISNVEFAPTEISEDELGYEFEYTHGCDQ